MAEGGMKRSLSRVSITSFARCFDDELQCSVCLEQYDNPKTLPCHHSFCSRCIKMLPTERNNGMGLVLKCPKCCRHHLVPENGYPTAFTIINFIDLKKKLDKDVPDTPDTPATSPPRNPVLDGSENYKTLNKADITQKPDGITDSNICMKHNDPMKIYCVTCKLVICRDCTFSKEHRGHKHELIEECFSEHEHEIKKQLKKLKKTINEVQSVQKQIDNIDLEVSMKGKILKENISVYAQEIIERVQSSCTLLVRKVDDIVQQKRQTLSKQKQLTDELYFQLQQCEERVESTLEEKSQREILADKKTMMEGMVSATQYINTTQFQPIERPDIDFISTDMNYELGLVTGTTYSKAVLNVPPCAYKQPCTAMLTIHSHDGSSLSLPPSLISASLSSTPNDRHYFKCNVSQVQHGVYTIVFTPHTRGWKGKHQLVVKIGGIEIPGSPFIVHVIPSAALLRGTPSIIKNRLNKPVALAVFDNGEIVLAEKRAHHVTILTKEGKKVKSFGTKGTGSGQFTFPRGLAISNDQHVLVTDEHRLQKVNRDGVCLKSVGGSASGNGPNQFFAPKGIAVHPTTGDVYVADADNNRIQVFTSDLVYSQTIAPNGDRAFNTPFDLVFDKNGEHMYVVEYYNHCISKLTRDGKFVARFSSQGNDPGKLGRPTCITISHDLLFLGEFDNNRVSVFDTSGNYVYSFGKKGTGVGEMDHPYGIAIDNHGNLFVNDGNNKRLIFYPA